MRKKHSRKKASWKFLFLLAGLGYFWMASDFQEEVLTTAPAGRVLQIGIIKQREMDYHLKPETVQDTIEKFISSMSFEALAYYDQEQKKLLPKLAESWKFSDDAENLTIQLKDNIYFHNGKKLKAEDIKKIWEKNFSSGENWKSYALIQDISGSEEFLNGAAEIEGIQAQGRQISIHFDKPNSAFPYMLTNPLFWVSYAEKSEEENIENQIPIPAGTGPYMMTNFTEKELLFTAFDKYYEKKPMVQQIKISFYTDSGQALEDFQQGKIAALLPLEGTAAENWIKNHPEGSGLHKQVLAEYYLLGFHQGLSPFTGSTDLRQAFNYMIDREKIIREITGPGFLPAKGPVPQGLAAYRPQILGYSYQPEQARNLLEQSGYTSQTYRNDLILSYHSGQGHQMVMEELQRQMTAFDIPVQLREADWNSFCYQLPRMGYRFFRLSWRADYPDADDFLYSLYHSSKIGISNYTGFQNRQVDDLLEQSRSVIEEEKRIRLQQQAEDIILDQAPQLWLFQKEMLLLQNPYVKGLEVNVSGHPDWSRVTIQGKNQQEITEIH